MLLMLMLAASRGLAPHWGTPAPTSPPPLLLSLPLQVWLGMTGMGATGGGLFLLSRDLLLLARYPDFARGEAVFVVFPDAKSQAVHMWVG